MTDAVGRTTSSSWPDGKLKTITVPDGATQPSVTIRWNPLSIRDPNGNVTLSIRRFLDQTKQTDVGNSAVRVCCRGLNKITYPDGSPYTMEYDKATDE